MVNPNLDVDDISEVQNRDKTILIMQRKVFEGRFFEGLADDIKLNKQPLEGKYYDAYDANFKPISISVEKFKYYYAW